MFGQLCIAAQYSGHAAGVFYPTKGIVDRLDDFGVIGSAKMPERGRKITRSDKHAIDAFDLRDPFQVLKPALRLHLQQKTNLLVRRLVIACDPAISGSSRLRREATKAFRRIAGRHDSAPRLLLGFNIGDQQRLRANVEQAFDDHLIVPGWTNNRVRFSAAGRLKLCEHHGQFVRRVLGIQQNPIETQIGEYFDDKMARQAVPQSDLQSAGLQRLLEGVENPVHRIQPEL